MALCIHSIATEQCSSNRYGVMTANSINFVTDMTLSVKSISKYHYHSTSHILYSLINDDNYSQLPNRPANRFSSNNSLRDCIGITFGYQAANGSSYNNNKHSGSNFDSDSTLSSSESINKQHYVKLCAD